jgi:hypothetical protein
LTEYLLNANEQGFDNATNATRLLLNADGSLSLINTQKQINLLRTNLLGIPVNTYGMAELTLNLY